MKKVGVDLWEARPQIEITLEVRRGKMNVSQDTQPDPGSSCQEAKGSLGPEG